MKNEGDIKVSIKQARRVFVLEQLSEGKMTNAEGAKALGLSIRQIQRIHSSFGLEGISSLIHGNSDMKPHNFVSHAIRGLVAERAGSLWKGASSKHMTELLFDETEISISAKTVIRILRENDIDVSFSHKGPRKRRGRKRKPRLGQMLQIDASPFDWLSDGSMLSMHGAIDDATGKITALWLEPTECLNGYFHVLERTLLRWGVPASIYSDAHTIFFSPKSGKLTMQEELEGVTVAMTQFGKSLDILGVTLIKASSPQAKGRIERLWGTLQHRLVVDMRIAGIKTIDEANVFLGSYLQKHNDMFAVSPEEDTSAFLPAPKEEDLPFILCRRENRKVTGDSTISWKGTRWMTLDFHNRRRLFKRGVTLEVLDLMDGSLAAQYKGDIFKLVKAPASTKKTNTSCRNKNSGKLAKQPHKPAPGHPWRDGYKNDKNNKRIPEHCLEEMTLGGDIFAVPNTRSTHDIFAVR